MLNLYIAVGRMAIVSMLTLLIYEHGKSFHLITVAEVSVQPIHCADLFFF